MQTKVPKRATLVTSATPATPVTFIAPAKSVAPAKSAAPASPVVPAAPLKITTDVINNQNPNNNTSTNNNGSTNPVNISSTNGPNNNVDNDDDNDNYDEAFIQDSLQLIASRENESPESEINGIKHRASQKYKSEKKKKQQELRLKHHHSLDSQIQKNQKKKIDNHASAVASRVKQEYLIHEYERVIHDQMKFAQRMVVTVRQMQARQSQQDEKFRHFTKKNNDPMPLSSSPILSYHHLSDHNVPHTATHVSALPDSHLALPKLEVPLSVELTAPEDQFMDTSTYVGIPFDISKLEPDPLNCLQPSFVARRQESLREHLQLSNQDDVLSYFNPVA